MKKVKSKKSKKENKNISAFKEKWRNFKLGEKILSIIMFILVGIFILGILFCIYIVIAAPSFDIEKLYTKEASIIYDSEGNEIARLGTENREKVTYDELPEVFIDALIATEDSRFYQHNGVDMARFIKASLGQVMGNSDAGGASTLTMQVAKQRYTSTSASGVKGIIRKFTDMYLSMFKIEKNYTKEQIIEFYVNIPDLGSGNYGIEQASESYFGKTASELTLSEAALIAGLFQAPYAYNPFDYPDKAEARRNQVLNLMKRHGYITDEECELAKQIPVKSMLSKETKKTSINQGFIDTVIEEVKERTGKNPYLESMKIYSTMVQSKQDVINDINNGVTYTWPNETLQAGIAVTDVKTGALVAVGAGRNRKGELSYNYATMINRHPGSSAKPIFDYGPAIEYENWSTGQTIVDDAYKYSNGGYIKNWDNSYKGIMTAKTALASSRNIPALQAFQAVDQDKINTFVTGLGIKPEYDEDGYINESHSIGGFNGVNPVQMSAAYGAFARGGVYIEPYSFTKVEFLDTGKTYTVTPEKRTVMSEATAYMINMILKYAVTSNNVTAGSKSGTDIASKTGTSTVDSSIKKAYGIKVGIIGDSWQMSYSPDYCCALWVGYDKITSTQYLTSSVGSKARKSITKLLTKGIQETNSRWKKPASVVTATIEKETIPLQLASAYTPSTLKSTEYFKKGTVPTEVSTRFSQLSNPSNLKANYSVGQVKLSWTGIPTPDAIDTGYLKDYFEDGYKSFASKYLNKRINYNNKNIGTNGYRVYIKKGSGGYTQLGFTTDTSYTYNGLITETTTFMVKSSYSIFTSNMSSGISITIDPTGASNVQEETENNTNEVESEEDNTTTNNNWNIELNGRNTMTVAEYYDLVSSGEAIINAISGGKNITNKNNIITTCEDSNGNEVDCNAMDCKQSYKVTHTYTLNGKTRNISRRLSAGC